MTSRDQEALRDILGVMDRALGFPIADFDALERTVLPGVNYVGGSRQLRRRVGAPTPMPWHGGGPRLIWAQLAGN